MKSISILKTVLIALVFTSLSCSEAIKVDPPSTSTPAQDGDVEGVGDNTALYLNVSSKWEGGSEYTSWGTCSVSSLTAPGTAVPNCEIRIPEGQLYFSDLKFTVGSALSAVCPIVSFSAYYYLRADTDVTFKGDQSQTTCAPAVPGDLPTDKKCYGGAAPVIFSDFPKNAGQYFLTALQTKANWVLPAENTTRWYNGGKVNIASSNSMSVANRPSAIPFDSDRFDSFVDGSMQDYEVVCRDYWYQPLYIMKLIVSDADTETTNGLNDQVDDWGEY